MTHKKIRIPKESANEILRALGSLKNGVEFEDLTKDDLEAKKNYSEMIKRCDEIKKKIFDFTKVCYDFHLPFNYFVSKMSNSEEIIYDDNLNYINFDNSSISSLSDNIIIDDSDKCIKRNYTHFYKKNITKCDIMNIEVVI